MLDHWIDILNERVPTNEEYAALVSLAEQHPFSSAVHALKARSAKVRSEGDFESIAIEAAIRAADRKALHSFVFGAENFSESVEEPIIDQEAHEEKPEPAQNKPTAENQERISELDRLLVSEALSAGAAIDLLAETEDEHIEAAEQKEVTEELEMEELATEEIEIQIPDKMSFSSWMHSLADPPEVLEEEKPKASVIAKKDTLAIIDHFIENESSLVPKRAEFFSPAKAAKNSLVDHDEIVSETLAQVYTAQGNYKKAISTYEKLGLLHPEKSSYFAALISKLKQNK